MSMQFAVCEKIEIVAGALQRVHEDSQSAVWVSLLDGHDLFASANIDVADDTQDKERRHFHFSWCAVQAFQGTMVPDEKNRIYHDATFAAFPQCDGGQPSPMDRALAAALMLREDCMRWNMVHTWKPCAPPRQGWQIQLHSRTGIAEEGRWIQALTLALQARRNEVLLEQAAWQKLGKREKLLLQSHVTGVRFGLSFADWQRSCAASRTMIEEVQGGKIDRDAMREFEQLGVVPLVSRGRPTVEN